MKNLIRALREKIAQWPHRGCGFSCWRCAMERVAEHFEQQSTKYVITGSGGYIMRDLIKLYILRYGITDSLQEIAIGFGNAAADHEVKVEEYRDLLVQVSTGVAALRNKFKDLER